ncbi:hypothetical protein RN001_005843 [Aquatica leii]|uniref:MADF domain-containing protein n=1 Tax=Aquatica leii TaxID=1421715 RepID=A0AAN7SJ86_9COLE|nr:hypothetical protein RN001_005843 [Aquatica leii]
MSWNQEEVLLLIEQYQKWPCLYAVRSKEYKNKHARVKALEDVFQVVKLLKSTISQTDMKTKFANLKTTFMQEFRKYKESFKSGAGTEDIYTPTLWYFQQMMYVAEHNEIRPAVDSIETNNEDAASDGEVGLEVDTCSSSTNSNDIEDTMVWEGTVEELETLGNCSTPTNRTTKRKANSGDLNACLNSADSAISDMRAAVLQNAAAKKPKNAAFGAYVAEKLTEITDPNLRLEAEYKINKVLFDALRQCNEILAEDLQNAVQENIPGLKQKCEELVLNQFRIGIKKELMKQLTPLLMRTENLNLEAAEKFAKQFELSVADYDFFRP